MFDVKSVNHRYFEVKLSITNENGEIDKSIVIEAEPPKVKVLKKILRVTKVEDDAIEELAECIRLILNKNKNKTSIPEEYIEDLDFDEMQSLLLEYFKWLGEIKNNPN